jgi:hypothetical protein
LREQDRSHGLSRCGEPHAGRVVLGYCISNPRPEKYQMTAEIWA